MTEIENISDGLAVALALEKLPAWQKPRWSELGFAVVDRGTHAIFPLAVATADASELAASTSAAGPRHLSPLESKLRMDCIHWFGGDFFHAESPLELDEGYGRRIMDAGAVIPRPTWLLWWGINKLAIILVRSVDHESALERLALHAIPQDWVWQPLTNAGTQRASSRARRMKREAEAADASWSWPL
jgi:hypothetical protein